MVEDPHYQTSSIKSTHAYRKLTIELSRRHPSDDLFKRTAKELKTTVEDLRSYDRRAPMEDLKRISDSDPTFGFALRKLVDKEITAEDLLRLADKKPDRKK